MFVIEGDKSPRQIIPFVPTALTSTNLDDLNKREINKRAREASTLGMAKYDEYYLSKIKQLSDRYWEASHQESTIDKTEKAGIIEEYERLKSIIEKLLGTELKRDVDGNPTLFNFSISAGVLSQGQISLLQFADAIHCQRSNLDELILLVDEPENHLHPSAIIEVIESLIRSVPNGQIWVATHSVSILAHFHREASLWYMDKNTIKSVGRIPESVLEGLLGTQERITHQIEFLYKPQQIGLELYASQCLSPPSAVMTGKKDPQITQIRNVVDNLYSTKNQLRLLDYGSGKGRLLATIADDSEGDVTINERIDYVALDKCDDNKAECEGQIVKAYGSCDSRWCNNYHSLISAHNKESFHIVIMCNVLHEISPDNWSKLFGPCGEVTELLDDDGYLLIVEDQRIPVGEHAHSYGFIVLDTGPLKDLFDIKGVDGNVVSDTQRDGRLKAHLIPNEYLKRYTEDTKKKALNSHRKHAKDEIKSIRESVNADNAKRFAFWIHQYANVSLAIDD